MLQRRADHAIFSLHDALVDAFLSGRKCVEIRRRAPILPRGSKIWLYGKLPVGQIFAVADLASTTVAAPNDLWSDFGPCSAISHGEFIAYSQGAQTLAALSLRLIRPLRSPLGLAALRRAEPGFHPPQFYRRVRGGSLLEVLDSAELADPLPVEIHHCERPLD